MIKLEQVSLSYGEKQVLRDFSCTLPESGLVCFFGPSGCGKTTLLQLLAGLRKPDSGLITGLDGKRVSVVFQENRLLPWLSVAENISLVTGGGAADALTWLEAVELAAEAQQPPAALSGGMQRRVAIARALAFDGDLLLLDEPFNGLDESLALRLLQRIQQQYAERLVVLITHDLELVRQQATQIIRVQGPPLQILNG